MIPRHEQDLIARYVEDFSRELRDRAPLKSSVTRAINIYAGSDLDLDTFLDLLQSARAATQKNSAGIRAESADGSGRKSKMAYLFAVLEDLVNTAA